jgi:hypothetical protein
LILTFKLGWKMKIIVNKVSPLALLLYPCFFFDYIWLSNVYLNISCFTHWCFSSWHSNISLLLNVSETFQHNWMTETKSQSLKVVIKTLPQSAKYDDIVMESLALLKYEVSWSLLCFVTNLSHYNYIKDRIMNQEL